MEDENIKEIKWIGSSQDDLRELPEEVRATFGYALYEYFKWVANLGMLTLCWVLVLQEGLD